MIAAAGKATNGDATVVTDVGQHQMWVAQAYPFTRTKQIITSGGLGTMGYGLPAAIGAKFANPDKDVILFVGDGGFQMTSEELEVIANEDLNIKIDPWARLKQLRKAMPRTLFQMLFRGSNAVGYQDYPDNVIQDFIAESAKNGIDVFRIFDSLNWLPQMEKSIEAVKDAGKIAEGTICYTGDILDRSVQTKI